jgi:hypothetical protein
VQCGLDRLAEGAVDPVRQQRVEARALVDLVEVDNGGRVGDDAAVFAVDRRSLAVVEQGLGEVGRREHVGEPQLVLDADEVAAVAVRHAGGSCIHAQLQQDLALGELGLLVVSELEAHAAIGQPGQRRPCLVLGRPHGLGVQRRLGQPLLEDSEPEEQLVGDDRVVHPHAALVEDAHDRPAVAQGRAQLLGEAPVGLAYPAVLERRHVCVVMDDPAPVEPHLEVVDEPVVVEVLAPQRVVGPARLRQRGVEVEQANQARPLPLPVRDGEDRAPMAKQSAEDLLAELPDSLGDDQGDVAVDAAEHHQAFGLAGDETVTASRVVVVGADDFPAVPGHCIRQFLLEQCLRLPAHAIRRIPVVAVGDHHDRHVSTDLTVAGAVVRKAAQGTARAVRAGTSRQQP